VARMGEERKCTRFWSEIPNERDHLEDRGVDERMRSGWILGRLVGGGVDSLAQDRGRWSVLVNVMMKLWVLEPRS
jgi:hypothetical protein